MNREELEKMFDNKFKNYSEVDLTCVFQDMKEFIFNEMLTEIFKDIIENYWYYDDWCWCCSHSTLEEDLIKDVKEFYNINL